MAKSGTRTSGLPGWESDIKTTWPCCFPSKGTRGVGWGEGGESEREGGSLTALMKKELICDNIIHDRRIILSYHLISLVKHSVMCLVPIHQGNDSKLTL